MRCYIRIKENDNIKQMDLKVLFRTLTLLALALFMNACSNDDEEAFVPTLEVTPANIAGTWKLIEWNNEPLEQGTYCYIVFNRRDKTFEMYQKFDSMYPRYITGSFFIEESKNGEYIIDGTYDYGNGEWNNSYIVTDLSVSGTMTWAVEGNSGDVSRYECCENIPTEIIESTKYLQ